LLHNHTGEILTSTDFMLLKPSMRSLSELSFMPKTKGNMIGTKDEELKDSS
jgi:hypothetical protein